MRAPRLTQPKATAILQKAFNEMVIMDRGKEGGTLWRLLEPKLGVRGIPLNHLRWAFKLAHGITLCPISRVAPGDR